MSRREHLKLYGIWNCMKYRCLSDSPNNHYAKNYRNRGITVCNEWRYSYDAFEKWALENGYAEGLSIDRINPDGNYEPQNCRWVTVSENSKRANTDRHKGYECFPGEKLECLTRVLNSILLFDYNTLTVVDDFIANLTGSEDASNFEQPNEATDCIETKESMNKARYRKYAKIRDSHFLRDSDVARSAEVSRSILSDWKSGRITPAFKNIVKISTFFGVSPSEFEITEGD